jgi:hypothetical protein
VSAPKRKPGEFKSRLRIGRIENPAVNPGVMEGLEHAMRLLDGPFRLEEPVRLEEAPCS